MRYNLRPSAPNPYRIRWQDAPEAKGVAIAQAVDLRAFCGPIKNQNTLQEGCCSAESGSSARELLARKYENDAPILAEAFLYEVEDYIQGTPGQDQGSTLECTQAALMQVGVCLERSDPFTRQDFDRQLTPALLAEAARYKIRIGYWAPTLDEILSALSAGYGVQLGILVHESFESEAVARTGDVPMPAPGEAVLGGHAVLAIGFDKAKEHLIVQNSWGAGWGDRGFFYLPFAYAENADLLQDARVYCL